MSNTNTVNGFARVKEMANGRWASIIGDLYPELSLALKKPGKTRCACPIHGSSKGRKADGFRFLDDFHKSGGGVCNTCGVFPTGIDLICFLENAQGRPKVALDILETYFGIAGNKRSKPRKLPPPVHVNTEAEDPKAIDRRLNLLTRIWSECVDLSELSNDHQAIRYLMETRGIDDLEFLSAQKHIRFHPNLFYARSEVKEHPPISFPGIVSMMHDVTGKAAGLHRIFLHPTDPAKAPVEENKKILRRLETKLNAAVRIAGRAPFTHHANVCEGIETGLAISCSTGHSVYAAGYATLLAHWNPPEGTRCVTIWCDRDSNKAGINHASKLKERLDSMGIVSRILLPRHLESDDEDWNDVLLRVGVEHIVDAYSGSSVQTTTL